jgi:hypothetical protein
LLADAFDCTTFVETVSALAKSSVPADFYAKLLAIRYKDGKPAFFSRNHFPEIDWIPNNRAAGHLEDITASVALANSMVPEVATKSIDRGKWFKSQVAANPGWRGLASAMNAAWSEPVKVELPYLPASRVSEYAAKIPSGTVLNLVRRPDDRHPVLISHQGFVIQKGGKTFLRHSTPSGIMKNSELAEYLDRLQKADRRWPLIGVNLNQFK